MQFDEIPIQYFVTPMHIYETSMQKVVIAMQFIEIPMQYFVTPMHIYETSMHIYETAMSNFVIDM